MTFEYVSTEEAIARDGLRMVLVPNVPSPWAEGAKGVLHLEAIDWVGVRLDYTSDSQSAWTGQTDGERSGPVAIYNSERPRTGWVEILLLAERLAVRPTMLPADAAERSLALGLAHELLGEQGLAWSRRLQLIHGGLQNVGGFSEPVARYLAPKYGYTPEGGLAAGTRVTQLLEMLASRLKAQRRTSSRYYLGNAPGMVDVYSATCIAMFGPLPEDQCKIDPGTRIAFETLDAKTEAALDPILFEHRDFMYAEHLELPLSL